MDSVYWNEFYKNNSINLNTCSDFCNFVIKYFENYNINNILDAGCGNGRDSRVLSIKYKVTAVDNSGFIPDNTTNCKFKNDSFITTDKENYDLIYSRFTFHSITNEEHLDFLSSIKANTYLAIEARSLKNSDNEKIHGTTHYRNYIELDYLTKLLEKNNFEILFINESDNVAIYKSENPICVRVICKKLIA